METTLFEKRVNKYLQCEKRTLAEMLALLDEKISQESISTPYISEPNFYRTPPIYSEDGWQITCNKDNSVGEKFNSTNTYKK